MATFKESASGELPGDVAELIRAWAGNTEPTREVPFEVPGPSGACVRFVSIGHKI